MGKLSRSFTCDLDVLAWLEQYSKKENKKQSYIVNSVLRDVMRHDQTWKCPECQASNDNRYSDCHGCEYVLSVKA